MTFSYQRSLQGVPEADQPVAAAVLRTELLERVYAVPGVTDADNRNATPCRKTTMFDPRDDARDRDGREDGRERVYDERDRDDDPQEA